MWATSSILSSKVSHLAFPRGMGYSPRLDGQRGFSRHLGLLLSPTPSFSNFLFGPLLLRLFCLLDFSICSLSLSASSPFVLRWAG